MISFTYDDEEVYDVITFPKAYQYLHSNTFVTSLNEKKQEFVEFALSCIFLLKFFYFSQIRIKTLGINKLENEKRADLMRRKVLFPLELDK